jgi:hypothetical protein
LNTETLEYLNLNSNNLQEEDKSNLSFFNKFKNLKELNVGNKNEEKIMQNIYNRFSGSLEPLKDLNNLRLLNIESTDVNSDIEHLPSSLEEFYCASELRKSDSKVKEIADKLSGYGKEGEYNLQA